MIVKYTKERKQIEPGLGLFCYSIQHKQMNSGGIIMRQAILLTPDKKQRCC